MTNHPDACAHQHHLHHLSAPSPPAPSTPSGTTCDSHEDICGLCGRPGADKMAIWTGGGVYWPGEQQPDTDVVHQACEQEETQRAHEALTQSQRDDVLRSVTGGRWP